MSQETDKKKPFQKATVELPVRYWITTLAIIDDYITHTTLPQFEKLQKEGKTPKDLSDAQSAVLIGPLVAHGVIVDSLADAGVMMPDAKKTHGMEALNRLAERWRNADVQKEKK